MGRTEEVIAPIQYSTVCALLRSKHKMLVSYCSTTRYRVCVYYHLLYYQLLSLLAGVARHCSPFSHRVESNDSIGFDSSLLRVAGRKIFQTAERRAIWLAEKRDARREQATREERSGWLAGCD